MSEPRFTPGPWAIARDDRPDMEWNNHIVRADDPNQAICFMTHSGTNDNSECEANAALIAAAPDLYAALEDLEKWCALSTKGELAELSLPRANARIALAKARGEK